MVLFRQGFLEQTSVFNQFSLVRNQLLNRESQPLKLEAPFHHMLSDKRASVVPREDAVIGALPKIVQRDSASTTRPRGFHFNRRLGKKIHSSPDSMLLNTDFASEPRERLQSLMPPASVNEVAQLPLREKPRLDAPPVSLTQAVHKVRDEEALFALAVLLLKPAEKVPLELRVFFNPNRPSQPPLRNAARQRGKTMPASC